MNLQQIKALSAGFDVSHHNVDARGKPIAWAAARAARFAFVFVNASDGPGFVDPKFAQNVEGASAAGVAVGAYHR